MNSLSSLTNIDYIILITSYLLGSIPFGLVISKIFLKKDIRTIGSGNIGATNMVRAGGKSWGIVTLILDGAKAIIAVELAKRYATKLEIIYFAGFLAVIGHIYPLWLKFKGGKGVATSIFMFLAISLKLYSFLAITWLIIFAITRISSLSAIIAFLLLPIVSFYQDNRLFWLCLSLSLIIIFKHKENIYRIIKGEEKKFK